MSTTEDARAGTQHDEIRLVVPAAPEFLRLARVTAAGLASRLGFTFDDVEDLRLAIDELCFTLIGGKGLEGAVELRYTVLGDALQITGLVVGASAHASELSDWSHQILAALVDEHELLTGDAPGFRLLKRRSD